MKKIIILIIAVISIGVLATGITIFANNPKVVALNSVEGLFEDLGERKEIAPFVNMARQGSVSFEIKDAEDEDNYISSEIFFDTDNVRKLAVLLNDFTMSYGDTSVKADLYFGYDYMYITEADVLGGTYGLVRGKMAEGFEESIFAHGSDSEYELDSDIYDTLLKIFEAYDQTDDQDAIKNGEKIIRRYTKEFKKLLGKYSEFEKVNDDVKLGGDQFGARVITVTITPETITNALNDLFEYVKDDKELKKYFINNADKFGLTDDADDLWDDFIDNFEEAVDELDPDEIDFKLKIKIITPKTSSELLGITVTVYEGKEKMELVRADFGKKGFKKTDCIALTIAEEDTIEYKISENNSSEYKSALYFNDEKVMSFKWNKKAEKYTLKAGTEGDETVIEGKLSHKSGKLSISVNKIDEEETPVEVTITINEKAKLPKRIDKSDVKLITDITEEDMEEIIDNARELGETFMEVLGIEGRSKKEYDPYYSDPYEDYYW